MKKVCLFFIASAFLLVPISCGYANRTIFSENKELLNPKVVNFKAQFNVFWKQAKGQTFEKQVELWTSVIETPYQDFFDSFVWSEKSNSNFSAKRLKQLQIIFRRIEKNETKIINDLQTFESVLASQLERYRKAFPNAEFPVDCYAAVGGNFLGRAGTNQKTKKKMLAFGIDKIADMNVNPDILYSHELFHIYHGIQSNIDSDERLIVQLWAEGLASFVSHELNPQASNKDIFIYESTAKIKNDQLPHLSSLFLKIAGNDAFDSQNDHLYFDWFLSEKDSSTLPAMAGYWLGYKVVENLRGRYSLEEMSQWSAQKADRMVRSVLVQFAQTSSKR